MLHAVRSSSQTAPLVLSRYNQGLKLLTSTSAVSSYLVLVVACKRENEFSTMLLNALSGLLFFALTVELDALRGLFTRSTTLRTRRRRHFAAISLFGSMLVAVVAILIYQSRPVAFALLIALAAVLQVYFLTSSLACLHDSNQSS